MSSLLSISNLHISVDKQEIIHGLNLEVPNGEVHAIMGPNGSGKSTLVNSLMGHPAYSITSGEVLLDGKDILKMETHERAQAGLFLAFQYPKTISGVSVRNFLFAAYTAQMAFRYPDKRKISPITFQALLQQKMELLHLDFAFSDRNVNEGFSGGEKKKLEILQMLILEPIFALLDETDSGLDIDALKIVADGVNLMRSGKFSCLLVTHYARILNYVTPDKIHVMKQGQIIESGGADLAQRLEKEGYEQIVAKS
ncbi:MAG: Fe-S cluster assembly ATPase SufC [Kiritimatiellales bacterium]|nr:Fe-S cluster assembly ATPase SufC [Kiritimatiellales bacterium]